MFNVLKYAMKEMREKEKGGTIKAQKKSLGSPLYEYATKLDMYFLLTSTSLMLPKKKKKLLYQKKDSFLR